MVVQRCWKIQGDAAAASSTIVTKSQPVGGNSSSEDSNGSNQTTHSIATSVTSTSHKTQDVAAAVSQNSSESFKYVTTPQMAESMLLRLRQRLSPAVASPESIMSSLDSLRSHLQMIFDNEIELVVKNFMDTYFKPAVKNLKENMGENSVTDVMLKTVVCALLEESKKKYIGLPLNSVQNSAKGTEAYMTSRLCAKRPATKAIMLSTEPMKKIINLPQRQTNPSINCIRANAECVEPLVRKLPSTQPRRQIFWNTAELSANTNFVLDVQANQAFGFGTDGRERLASKHPELIRYLPDGDDRDWLVAQNIISQQNRNSRFLFLIHDEVLKLYYNNDLYKTKPNINLSIMHTFKVPEFIIEKMKVFFVDLNIKSRGLITNSFCTTPLQNSSHLRNALLQGTPTPSTSLDAACSTAATGNLTSSISTTTESIVTTTTISSSAKSKPSTLSSSHATLTALLNNPNSSLGAAIIKSNSNISGRSSVTHNTADTAGKQ